MTGTADKSNLKNNTRTPANRRSQGRLKAAKPTKKARLICLLEARDGADVATISKRLGWLPHTVRAALSGLRKAGYEITSIRQDREKPARYRIVAVPEIVVPDAAVA